MYQYVLAKDAEADAILATRPTESEADTTPVRQRFLKASTAKTRAHVRELFKHIDCGCLSDPDPAIVNIFRRNPVTGVTHVARGTNTNERDNLDLGHKILTATHIGKFNLVHMGSVSVAEVRKRLTVLSVPRNSSRRKTDVLVL